MTIIAIIAIVAIAALSLRLPTGALITIIIIAAAIAILTS